MPNPSQTVLLPRALALAERARPLARTSDRLRRMVHPCADMGRGHAHKSMDMQGLLGFESLHTDSKLGSQVHERFCCYRFLAVVVH